MSKSINDTRLNRGYDLISGVTSSYITDGFYDITLSLKKDFL